MTYGQEVRALVRMHVLDGESVEFSSETLNIDKQTVVHMRKCWNDNGTLFYAFPRTSGVTRSINADHQCFLRALLRSRSDWYLHELQEEMSLVLGECISLATLWMALDHEGITHKK
ncbi:hypothetical protein HDU78_009884, partial [Chytriomyces hyalinus]